MKASDELERGRHSYAERRWADAYASLARADEARALTPADLERLSTAAFMLGRDDEHLGVLERAHLAHRDAGDSAQAVRCAFWIGMHLLVRGEVGPGTGWLARAQRLLEREPLDCVERGYALMPVMYRHEVSGELDAAYETADEAAAIAERFGDRDLAAIARHVQGRVRARQGRVAEGLALLDETMVAVTAGELSPIVTGLVYCSVIEGCQEVYALGRAREWTAALAAWCEGQRGLVAFTGTCLVHRAEILQLHGRWDDALEEAHEACRRFAGRANQPAEGLAMYHLGEVHRLHGEFVQAEEAYREAAVRGCEPQPGLALLRLAQGRGDAAAAAIRRAAAEHADPLRRARLLPACVEIMLAVGETGEAEAACRELEEIAAAYESSGVLGATAAQARGALRLAAGDAAGALQSLRHAWRLWQELEAPYPAARTRLLLAEACRAMGDVDAAELELEAARAAFEQLGAAADLRRFEEPGRDGADDRHGLTARELEVLRLVASGRSNRDIAAALTISEHTVARHLQNIFAKLGLSSRTAASAFAYEHDLV